MMGLQFIVFRTRFGLAMRAVAHDPRVASLMGIPVDSVISKTFMLGSALAAAANIASIARVSGSASGVKSSATARSPRSSHEPVP